MSSKSKNLRAFAASRETKKEGVTPALVPKLRFPEFRDAEWWKVTPLQTIARPVADRAVTGDADNILSLSGEHGLVLQSDYFGKKIAGDSAERYLKLLRNDFVYNDRTTKASTFGTIKRLSKYDGGIVSPIYKCFRFHSDENPVFWEWYFESGSHEAALRGLVNEGARAGRFNISISQFLSTAAPRPEESEQQKIAECLSSVDELIAAQARKVDALKTHKKGLMQQLFPREGETQPRLRFPEFQNAGEWEEKPLKEVFSIFQGFAFSSNDSVSEGVRWLKIADVSIQQMNHCAASYLPPDYQGKYQKFAVKRGDYVMALTRPILSKQLKMAPVDEVFDGALLNQRVGKLVTAQDITFVYFLLQTSKVINDIEKSISGSEPPNLSAQQLEDIKTYIPSKRPEQQRIASCLSSLDALITAETQKHEALKTHKKALMQQLFPTTDS